MARTIRILLSLVALGVAAAPAAATPVDTVTARQDGEALVVTARVTSPVGGGCAVSVHAGWSRVVPQVRHGAREAQVSAPIGVATGLVRKTDHDGGVTVDACAEAGDAPLETHGTVRLQFRPGRLAPGAYRVCVRASQRAGARVNAHRACAVVRVAAVRV